MNADAGEASGQASSSKDGVSSPSQEEVTSHSQEGVTSPGSPSEEKWGFDLYPERRGGKYKPSLTKIALLGEGRENLDKVKCEKNVWKCVQRKRG